MCIPAMGGGPFGPASVLPRSPANRTRTGTARRSTRLTLPPAEGAATPGLTPPPQPGSAAAALPIGRLLQLGGLAAGPAQGVGRTTPASRTAQVPQPVPATPSPGSPAPRPNVAGDAGSDGRLILKQVSQGKMRPVDAILGFEDLLSRRNVSPDARRELTMTFGENLARATRRRFSVHSALQQLSAAQANKALSGGHTTDARIRTIDGVEVLDAIGDPPGTTAGRKSAEGPASNVSRLRSRSSQSETTGAVSHIVRPSLPDGLEVSDFLNALEQRALTYSRFVDSLDFKGRQPAGDESRRVIEHHLDVFWRAYLFTDSSGQSDLQHDLVRELGFVLGGQAARFSDAGMSEAARVFARLPADQRQQFVDHFASGLNAVLTDKWSGILDDGNRVVSVLNRDRPGLGQAILNQARAEGQARRRGFEEGAEIGEKNAKPASGSDPKLPEASDRSAARPNASTPTISTTGAETPLTLRGARLVHDRDRLNRQSRPRDDTGDGTIAARSDRNEWTQHFDYTTLFSGSIEGTRSRLRRNMLNDKGLGLKGFTGWQANHIVPWQQREHPLITRLGMNPNDPQNGIALPDVPAGNLSVHMGSHDGYNVAIKELLNRIESMPVSDSRKRDVLAEFIERTRQALLGGVPQITQRRGGTDEAWRRFFDRVSNDMGLFHNR